jgi:hypothetical protein
MARNKAKIYGAISFLLVLVIALYLFNSFYVHHASKAEPAWIKETQWNLLKEELTTNNTLRYAFFGDSVTLQGAHTPSISSSYNFALAGEDYPQTFYRYKAIQEETDIKHLVMQLSRHTFSAKYQVPKKRFSQIYYYSRIVPTKELYTLKAMTPTQLKIRQYVPSIGQGRSMLRALLGYEEHYSAGWKHTSVDYTTYRNEQIAQHWLETFFPQATYVPDTTTQTYFLKLIAAAQEQNQTIILVIYPLEKDFAKRLDAKQITKAKTIDPFLDLLASLNTTYLLLDYETLLVDSPEYFSDPAHLNYHGALAFTEQLAQDLERIP